MFVFIYRNCQKKVCTNRNNFIKLPGKSITFLSTYPSSPIPRSPRRRTKVMDKLTEVTLVPLQSEKYMRPQSMLYTQNGEKKCWDLLCVHQGVFIIILNVTRNVLIFVRQFRPPVYLESVPKEDRFGGKIDTMKYPASLGITLELCAGMVDKDLLTLQEIAAEEVLEECGYKVDSTLLETVCSFPSSVGTTGAKMHLFYCEVTDDMKIGAGGGVHDEIIDVVEMNVDEVKTYMKQKHIVSPPSFLYGVQWFLMNKVGTI